MVRFSPYLNTKHLFVLPLSRCLFSNGVHKYSGYGDVLAIIFVNLAKITNFANFVGALVLAYADPLLSNIYLNIFRTLIDFLTLQFTYWLLGSVI